MSFILYLFMSCENLLAQNLILPEIRVEGQKSLRSDPSSIELSGSRLDRKKQSSLGETLSHESGVASSQFGPNASRPILRGLEGDRVRLFQNGVGLLDASSLSQDHAVAIDPLILEGVEILRGPKSLLYGNQVVGGVVNLKTHQIPDQIKNEINTEAAVSSNDLGRSFSLSGDQQLSSSFEAHVDTTARAAEDYHAGGERIYNSLNRTASQNVGTSYITSSGYFGISFSNYNSRYGTIIDPNGLIALLQQRINSDSALKFDGFINEVKIKNSFSHYTHDERENNTTASRFNNDGNTLRIEANNQALKDFKGTFGIESSQSRFAVVGEDKLVPESYSSKYSLFIFEQQQTFEIQPSFAFRTEFDQVTTNDDPTFGASKTKQFQAYNAAFGLYYKLNDRHSLKTNFGFNERAPSYEELFANGPHDATKQFEIGDQNLTKEQSKSLEVIWVYDNDLQKIQTSAYIQDFSGFISLSPMGQIDSGSQLSKYQFLPLPARFYGGEIQFKQKLSNFFSLEFKLDSVRAYDRSTQDNLPRISPLRESLTLLYNSEKYQSDFEIINVHQQNLNAPNESTTAGYALVNAGVNVPIKNVDAFFRLNNLLDSVARNHTSVLKDVAPLVGRNLSAGLRATF